MNGLHVLNVPGMNTAKETKSVPQVTPSKNATMKQKIVFAIRNQSVASQIMTVKVITVLDTIANVFICQDMEVEHVLEQKRLINNKKYFPKILSRFFFTRFTFTLILKLLAIYTSDELCQF